MLIYIDIRGVNLGDTENACEYVYRLISLTP